MKLAQEHALAWDVLDRYFSGEASADDVTAVERWASENGGRELLRSIREIWDAAGVMPSPVLPDLDNAWRSVWGQAEADGPQARIPGRSRPVLSFSRVPGRERRSMWRTPAFAGLAALVLIMAGGVAVVKSRAPNGLGGKARVAAAHDREFVTRRAQRADLYLADGSRVILNVDSRLDVPAGFDAGSREVTLSGEAYFSVAPDAAKPFRVRTATGVVEVTGTTFFVSEYPEVAGMRVGVASGSVVVRDGAGAVAAPVSHGELARLDRSGQFSVRRDVKIAEEVAWTDGRLVFSRTPLREAIPRLSRWLDVDVRLGDSALAPVRYTASFTNESPAQIVELLAAALDARVQRDSHGGYVLYAKPDRR